MKWLLVYMFIHYGGYIEFDTKLGCQEARVQLLEKMHAVRDDEVVCVERK